MGTGAGGGTDDELCTEPLSITVDPQPAQPELKAGAETTEPHPPQLDT